MIYKEHIIELFINGQKADLESQKSLNLRFQNVLFNPEKITSSQAEYSFEFELPSTAINDKIFDFSNNLSKTGKFVSRLNAELYVDGTPIFAGTLTLNSIKEKKYNCNLVSVKVYSLEDIFGEAMLSDIDNWKIPFNGVETINQINGELNPDVVFPFVSYGAFQKSPKYSDDAGNDYTSKYDLDEYNRWYVESFAPSLKMLEVLKHAFNFKNYKVGGDAFTDMFLNKIYLSTNLADGQSPDYNVGNPRFGNVDIEATIATNGIGYIQQLNFPYYQVYAVGATSEGITSDTQYNLSAVETYNVLNGTVTCNQSPSYMYQPNESIIVIPADGWYRIELSATTTLNTTGDITAGQYLYNLIDREISFENVTMPSGLNEITPVEIQLVRNYDDNIELIKGRFNRKYVNGNPNDSTYPPYGRDNVVSWYTCFPHEDPYNSTLPTEKNNLTIRSSSTTNRGGRRSSTTNTATTSNNNITSTSGNFSGYRGGTRGGTIDPSGGGRDWSPLAYGYVYEDGDTMAYDQAVSPAFICGFSSLYGGITSVMKNGYSWSKSSSDKNEAFYNNSGYSFVTREAGTGNLTSAHTDFNTNVYYNTPFDNTCTVSGNTMTGKLSCMVWLNKNDILQLMAIHRDYTDEVGNSVSYNTTTNVHLKIRAYSDRSYYDMTATSGNSYTAPVEFDERLNLANFMNKEKKISDWVQNVIDAYNLELIQNGNTVEINTKKKFNRHLLAAVELDDRANSANAEAEKINYPKSMSVRYKIDTDEHGFYNSVPADKIDLPNWKDYGDSGYSVVQLNSDSYVTETSDKQLQFSYTWYDDFNWYPVDSAFTKDSGATSISLSIPVISKEEYMIDGYDYTESLKHDGYGLAQRFWFKPSATNCYVWTRTYPVEQVFLYEPKNLYTNYQDIYMNLSYKVTENSLLKQYFNFVPYLASNYVEVEVYLTPDEYNMVKNGSLIHFDKDIYYPVEVSGYDPSGYNPTSIKMMKKL